ncbi:unnamed protein product [marine sediment metagenome]|uniref:Uncharacterized protein n=1 Tax=marine sediment metagenome TaxID=412755 RepID=X0YQV6_9ZZZZ
MPRIRSLDVDAYNITQVNNALDLLIQLTDDIAGIMRHMSPAKRKALWRFNAKAITLGQKLRQIDENLDDMDPRA